MERKKHPGIKNFGDFPELKCYYCHQSFRDHILMGWDIHERVSNYAKISVEAELGCPALTDSNAERYDHDNLHPPG